MHFNLHGRLMLETIFTIEKLYISIVIMPLKIQYCSDLHLEFSDNQEFLMEYPIQAKGDILILAGDIIPFAVLNEHKYFLDDISKKFEAVYWIPGNHEYYHFDLAKKSGTLNEKIRKNVFLVNNVSLLCDNVRLIFSTLWSKITPANQWQIEKSINDFRMIRYNKFRFSAELFNQLHEEAYHFIEQEITKEHPGKTVVVTHHVPTFMNYPEIYKGDALSEAFTVEVFDFIEQSGINYWIYGHHHTNTPAFKIGTTQLLTNQLGYVRFNEHRNFDNARIIT
jgi:predicted phosphohydrolase